MAGSPKRRRCCPAQPGAMCDPPASVSPGTEWMLSARTFLHPLPVHLRGLSIPGRTSGMVLLRVVQSPLQTLGQLGSHPCVAAPVNTEGKRGSPGQEGQQGCHRAGWGKTTPLPPLAPADPVPSCPRACQVSSSAQPGLGTRGQFGDTSGGVRNSRDGDHVAAGPFPCWHHPALVRNSEGAHQAPHGVLRSAWGSSLAWDPFPAPRPRRKDLGPCLLLAFPAASMETEHKAAEQSVRGRTDRQTDRQTRADGGSGPCEHPQIRRSPRRSEGNRGTGWQRGDREESDAGSAGIPLAKQISNSFS